METRLPWRPTRGSLTSPSYLVKNRTLGPPLKSHPSRLESRAGFFASFRDECLSPRVRLECNPEIPVASGEEHCLLDTSLDEVYWPCSHSRAIPSFPSQLEWKIGLPWANTRGILNSPS